MNPIETILRRWRLVLLVTLLCTAASTVAAFVTPPTYRATSTLLLKLGREFMYRPEVGPIESRGMYRLAEMMNSEAEILESSGLALAVIERIGAETLFPELEELDESAAVEQDLALRKFTAATTVRSIEDSSILKLYFEHEDPVLAARALDTLLEVFLLRHTELFGDSSSEFLETHEREAARRVELAIEAVRELKSSKGIVDLDHQLQLLLSRSAELEIERASVGRRLQEVGRVLKAFETDDPERDATAWLTPLALGGAVEQALQERLRLALLQQESSVTYDPESRRLRGLRNELASLDRFLRDSVSFEWTVLEERARALEADRMALAEEVSRLSDASRVLQGLELEVTHQQEVLANAVARLADARLSKKLDEQRMISVKVIDGARVPSEPRGLSKSMRLVLGAIAGLAFGIALVVSLDALRAPS